jgi:iron complex outermembrane receptor protein
MNRKLTLNLLPACLLLLLPTAKAADGNVFSLGEIKVTATPLGQGALGGSTLDVEEIRQQDRATVGDAVDLLPGVNLSKVGARNEQMLYLRGFDLRQVPIYIDGIPIYVPYDGYVDLGRFSTFDLSRIEVAKGFSSTVYGSNTLGGAINLVSRRPSKAFEGEVGGSLTFTDRAEQNGVQAYTNLGTNQGTWYLQGSASYMSQDYFRLPGDFSAAKGEDGGRRDNSYQHDNKGSLKFGWTPNATDEYAINIVSQHGVKGVPPYAGSVAGVAPRYWQWPYWDKDSVYFLSTTQFGDHALKLRLYHDTFKNSLFTYDNAAYNSQKLKSSFASWYDDYSDGASVEGDFTLSAANKLRLAWHVKEDVHREHNAGEPIRRDKDRTQSLGVEDSHAFNERLSLVTGLSFDKRETLEAQDFQNGVVKPFPLGNSSATNGQAGVFYKTSDSGQVQATVARKSRFPTIKDRYSYRLGTALPNADLKMEEATHYELGYAGRVGTALRYGANVFYSDISNLIQSVSIPASQCASPPCTQMQNVGKASSSGLELSLNGLAGAWDYAANYTYLERKNKSSPGVFLTDTPKHKLFASTTWIIGGGWHSTASVEALSSRYSTSDGKQVAAGFAVANLKAGYRLNNGTLIEGGVRNLFDRLYAYSEGFPEPGRTWFVQFNAPL